MDQEQQEKKTVEKSALKKKMRIKEKNNEYGKRLK